MSNNLDILSDEKEKENDNQNQIDNVEKAQENEEKQKEKQKDIKEEKRKEIFNSDIENMPYEVLKEDYPQYDLSFKIIVIGDSGI